MANSLTSLLGLLLIYLLLVKVSPTLYKHFSSIAYHQPDKETNEKCGEKSNDETKKSIKSTEFIDSNCIFLFEPHSLPYNSYIFTPTTLNLILEMPKRPPQNIS